MTISNFQDHINILNAIQKDYPNRYKGYNRFQKIFMDWKEALFTDVKDTPESKFFTRIRQEYPNYTNNRYKSIDLSTEDYKLRLSTNAAFTSTEDGKKLIQYYKDVESVFAAYNGCVRREDNFSATRLSTAIVAAIYLVAFSVFALIPSGVVFVSLGSSVSIITGGWPLVASIPLAIFAINTPLSIQRDITQENLTKLKDTNFEELKNRALEMDSINWGAELVPIAS